MSNHNKNRYPVWRHTALALALSVSLGGVAMAQSTSGSIFGQAPAAAGETVVATNTTGQTREVAVDSQGRYQISSVPVGVYTVSLKKDGAIIDSRKNVAVSPGAGATVSFAAAAPAGTTSLGAVTVQANALPTIDVSSVNSSTVITAAAARGEAQHCDHAARQQPRGHRAHRVLVPTVYPTVADPADGSP